MTQIDPFDLLSKLNRIRRKITILKLPIPIVSASLVVIPNPRQPKSKKHVNNIYIYDQLTRTDISISKFWQQTFVQIYGFVAEAATQGYSIIRTLPINTSHWIFNAHLFTYTVIQYSLKPTITLKKYCHIIIE